MVFFNLLGLSACTGGDDINPPASGTEQSQPETSPNPPQTLTPEPLPVPTPPASDDGLSLSSDSTTYGLLEGNDTTRILIQVNRGTDNERQVNLSVNAADAPSERKLNYQLATAALSASEDQTTLDVKLDIDVAPVLPHQRTLIVQADDGINTQFLSLTLDVEPVQAPDVYLLVGQSNMEGYSEVDAKDAAPGGPDASNARILQLNVTSNNEDNFASASDFRNPDKNVSHPRFVEAQDPLHESFKPAINGKSGGRIGLGLSFAKSALANTTQNIILVPAAWASTGFCHNGLGKLAWNPEPPGNQSLGGTALYDRAITRVDMTLRETGGILRGILWHQGEADATTELCSAVYNANLKKLIASFRDDIQQDARGSAARGAGSDVPFVLGTMAKGNDERGEFSNYDAPKTQVDLVHRTIESTVPNTRLSIHDDLIPPAYECGQGFCIHFGASAYREIGRRYYDSLLDIAQR